MALLCSPQFVLAQDDLSSEMQNAENAAGGPSVSAGTPNGPASMSELQDSGSEVPLTPAPAEQPQGASQAQPEQLQPPEQAGAPAQPEPPAVQAAPPPLAEPVQVTTDEDNEPVVDETGQRGRAHEVCQCHISVNVPYRERRTTWGGIFGIQVGQYAPVNYQPDFSPKAFDAYYPTGNRSPSFELVFGPKLNFSFGSLTAQLGAGFFTAKNTDDPANNVTLQVIPITLGGILALDTLFSEPYIVPYGGVGAYTGLYKESAGGFSVQGNTAVAPYFEVGLMFQLDALDHDTHVSAYEEYGMENTYLYIEGRSFLASGGSLPDLSTPLQLAGGIKVEF